MPTDLVYEYALNLAETGEFDRAQALFHNRFFLRAEGGTNVRQVWVEVRLQQALKLAGDGHCDAALKVASQLGEVVPELAFTRDGMQPVLGSARNSYLLGDLQARCGQEERADEQFERAASQKNSGQIAWAFLAAKRLSNFDQDQWRARLLSLLAAEGSAESSLAAYNRAMVEQQLGDEAAANSSFRETFLMPDSQMAYHLSRLALSQILK